MTLYDLRSGVEEVKWDNMRKSVGELNVATYTDEELHSHFFKLRSPLSFS